MGSKGGQCRLSLVSVSSLGGKCGFSGGQRGLLGGQRGSRKSAKAPGDQRRLPPGICRVNRIAGVTVSCSGCGSLLTRALRSTSKHPSLICLNRGPQLPGCSWLTLPLSLPRACLQGRSGIGSPPASMLICPWLAPRLLRRPMQRHSLYTS